MFSEYFQNSSTNAITYGIDIISILAKTSMTLLPYLSLRGLFADSGIDYSLIFQGLFQGSETR